MNNNKQDKVLKPFRRVQHNSETSAHPNGTLSRQLWIVQPVNRLQLPADKHTDGADRPQAKHKQPKSREIAKDQELRHMIIDPDMLTHISAQEEDTDTQMTLSSAVTWEELNQQPKLDLESYISQDPAKWGPPQLVFRGNYGILSMQIANAWTDPQVVTATEAVFNRLANTSVRNALFKKHGSSATGTDQWIPILEALETKLEGDLLPHDSPNLQEFSQSSMMESPANVPVVSAQLIMLAQTDGIKDDRWLRFHRIRQPTHPPVRFEPDNHATELINTHYLFDQFKDSSPSVHNKDSKVGERASRHTTLRTLAMTIYEQTTKSTVARHTSNTILRIDAASSGHIKTTLADFIDDCVVMSELLDGPDAVLMRLGLLKERHKTDKELAVEAHLKENMPSNTHMQVQGYAKNLFTGATTPHARPLGRTDSMKQINIEQWSLDGSDDIHVNVLATLYVAIDIYACELHRRWCEPDPHTAGVAPVPIPKAASSLLHLMLTIMHQRRSDSQSAIQRYLATTLILMATSAVQPDVVSKDKKTTSAQRPQATDTFPAALRRLCSRIDKYIMSRTTVPGKGYYSNGNARAQTRNDTWGQLLIGTIASTLVDKLPVQPQGKMKTRAHEAKVGGIATASKHVDSLFKDTARKTVTNHVAHDDNPGASVYKLKNDISLSNEYLMEQVRHVTSHYDTKGVYNLYDFFDDHYTKCAHNNFCWDKLLVKKGKKNNDFEGELPPLYENLKASAADLEVPHKNKAELRLNKQPTEIQVSKTTNAFHHSQMSTRSNENMHHEAQGLTLAFLLLAPNWHEGKIKPAWQVAHDWSRIFPYALEIHHKSLIAMKQDEVHIHDTIDSLCAVKTIKQSAASWLHGKTEQLYRTNQPHSDEHQQETDWKLATPRQRLAAYKPEGTVASKMKMYQVYEETWANDSHKLTKAALILDDMQEILTELSQELWGTAKPRVFQAHRDQYHDTIIAPDRRDIAWDAPKTRGQEMTPPYRHPDQIERLCRNGHDLLHLATDVSIDPLLVRATIAHVLNRAVTQSAARKDKDKKEQENANAKDRAFTTDRPALILSYLKSKPSLEEPYTVVSSTPYGEQGSTPLETINITSMRWAQIVDSTTALVPLHMLMKDMNRYSAAENGTVTKAHATLQLAPEAKQEIEETKSDDDDHMTATFNQPLETFNIVDRQTYGENGAPSDETMFRIETAYVHIYNRLLDVLRLGPLTAYIARCVVGMAMTDGMFGYIQGGEETIESNPLTHLVSTAFTSLPDHSHRSRTQYIHLGLTVLTRLMQNAKNGGKLQDYTAIHKDTGRIVSELLLDQLIADEHQHSLRGLYTQEPESKHRIRLQLKDDRFHGRTLLNGVNPPVQEMSQLKTLLDLPEPQDLYHLLQGSSNQHHSQIRDADRPHEEQSAKSLHLGLLDLIATTQASHWVNGQLWAHVDIRDHGHTINLATQTPTQESPSDSMDHLSRDSRPVHIDRLEMLEERVRSHVKTVIRSLRDKCEEGHNMHYYVLVGCITTQGNGLLRSGVSATKNRNINTLADDDPYYKDAVDRLRSLMADSTIQIVSQNNKNQAGVDITASYAAYTPGSSHFPQLIRQLDQECMWNTNRGLTYRLIHAASGHQNPKCKDKDTPLDLHLNVGRATFLAFREKMEGSNAAMNYGLDAKLAQLSSKDYYLRGRNTATSRTNNQLQWTHVPEPLIAITEWKDKDRIADAVHIHQNTFISTNFNQRFDAFFAWHRMFRTIARHYPQAQHNNNDVKRLDDASHTNSVMRAQLSRPLDSYYLQENEPQLLYGWRQTPVYHTQLFSGSLKYVHLDNLPAHMGKTIVPRELRSEMNTIRQLRQTEANVANENLFAIAAAQLAEPVGMHDRDKDDIQMHPVPVPEPAAQQINQVVENNQGSIHELAADNPYSSHNDENF